MDNFLPFHFGPDEAASVLGALTDLVVDASRAIGSISLGDVNPRLKSDNSPVTLADEAAETIILSGLSRLLPKVIVISEEQSFPSVDRVEGSFILVDPLDGTREFLAGRPDYTVNVGIIASGCPIAGVIAAPAQGLVWRGVVGKGAERLNFDGTSIESIRTRPWPSESPVAMISRSHLDSKTERFLTQLPAVVPNSAGSSLKFCRLAEGRADIYPRLGTTCEWDIAAGDAILTAAGGCVTCPQGGPQRYGNSRDEFRVSGFLAWGDRTNRWIPSLRE